MALNFELPSEIATIKEQLLNTALPYIKVLPKADTSETALWQSKIGGFPYLPKNETFPVGKNEKNMFFLAQFNFEELPQLADFPEKGILQFFVADDSTYGCNFSKPSKSDMKVVFYPEIFNDLDYLQTDFSFISAYENTPFVFNPKGFALQFELDEEVVPMSDYRFHALIGDEVFEALGDGQWDIRQTFNEKISAKGHKIGGYAYFTQEDIRSKRNPLILLFQLDSDGQIACRWGDMGVANFFIKKEDLLNRNFSKVVYNWDCF